MTTAQSVEAQTTQDTSEPRDWGSIAVSFARQMRLPHIVSRGDLAELRRMDPESSDLPAAYWRLMAENDLFRGRSIERKWALILHGIALMTPRAAEEGDSRTAHEGFMPVGRALFLGGDADRRERGYYSESRLNRLLSARGSMLRSLLARMFRMMAAADQPFNWSEMARFILNEDDDARIDIARSYYRAQYASYQANTENE